MYFLIFEFRVQHFVEQQRDFSLQPFSSFNSPLNKLDFRFQQEVNMAVSLNTIEMNQHAKETQEFINEDRSTHDLNMEDFGIKIEEGQQTFQQYFGKVKEKATLGMSTVFLWLMLTTEEFNSLPREMGNITFLAGSTRLP